MVSASTVGTHTIAVVNGPESRDTLESSFKEVFGEANDIIKSGYITIDGEQEEIELFLEGDYKVTCQYSEYLLHCTRGASNSH